MSQFNKYLEIVQEGKDYTYNEKISLKDIGKNISGVYQKINYNLKSNYLDLSYLLTMKGDKKQKLQEPPIVIPVGTFLRIFNIKMKTKDLSDGYKYSDFDIKGLKNNIIKFFPKGSVQEKDIFIIDPPKLYKNSVNEHRIHIHFNKDIVEKALINRYSNLKQIDYETLPQSGKAEIDYIAHLLENVEDLNAHIEKSKK
jgi:hypothetical protein